MMRRINPDRHQLWVLGRSVASEYLRGNCLGALPSTCRKPICPQLLEGLSYSFTRQPPLRIRPSPTAQAHGGGRSPHAHCAHPSTHSSPLCLGQSPPAAGSYWRQRSLNFCSSGGGDTQRACPHSPYLQIVNKTHGTEQPLPRL